MRPVTKPGQPAGYAPPATLKFVDGKKSKNATLMKGELGTANPTLAKCLELWEKVVNRRMLGQPITPHQLLREALVSERIGDIYRSAGQPLVDFLGAYCSYCESPLLGQTDVEHTVNKSGFPTYSCNWDNFLLACSACNGAGSKGNNPTRAQVYAAISGTIPNPTDPNYYAWIRDQNYVWPDRTPPNSYQVMVPQLFYDSGNGLADPYMPLPIHIAVDPNNRFRSFAPATHTVTADLYDGATKLDNVPVQARVVPAGDRAKDMTRLVNLNRPAVNVTDRRVPNRTRAWLATLADIRRLKATSDFATLWEGIVDNSHERGFFSVYIRLLSGHTDPSNTNLAVRFVAETGVQFPNTNTTLVP